MLCRIISSFVIINFAAAAILELKDYKLELLQVLFRHGDRIIDEDEVYPKDPYGASDYEPYGFGELTNKGKRREYEIGQMLREQYGEFLGETYEPDEVYAYSTDTDRTKMSLQLTLAGLYPPTPNLTWNKHLDWTPIPFFYNPRKFDFLSTSEQCPEYGELFNETVASAEVQEKLNKYRDLVVYLSNNTGLGFDPYIGSTLYYNIRSQMSLDLPLPKWCTPEVFQKLEEIAALRFDVYTCTNALRKLAVGPNIRRFLRNINDNESKSSTKKIYLYSAHDNNVIPYLRAHNFTTPRLADFGSTVIFEKLKGKDNQIYIRLVYWSGVGEKLSVLKLKDCTEVCLLSDYLKLVDPILPTDDGTECLYKEAFRNVKSLINGTINNEAINKRSLVYV